MKTTTTVAQMLVRGLGLIQIILGLLIWAGYATGTVNVHMLLGVVFVLALWTLCGVAVAAHQSIGFVAFGVIWGVIVLALGMMQTGMLVGSSHWVIRVLHLLVGLAAMGIGERLAKGIKLGTSV